MLVVNPQSSISLVNCSPFPQKNYFPTFPTNSLRKKDPILFSYSKNKDQKK